MTRTLVTGGAGFIGSHLVERLVRDGHDVVVLDDLSLGRRENLAHLVGRFEFLEGSILDVASMRRELAGVTRVFHLAALISGYDSLNGPEAYFRTNVIGLLRIVDAFGRVPGLKLVFASSSTLYGARGDSPCAEGDLPSPVTAYALSKLSGEHVLAMYSALHGFEHTSLRLFNVYGPRQNPDHPYANVTCKISRAAALGLSFTLFGDGEQTRDFVYVEDVVEALVRAAGRTPRAIYNVGTGRETSIRGLIAAAQAHAGAEIELDVQPPWPNDVRRVRADVGAIRDDLGFEARVPIEDGLERTIDWFRRHGSA
jgi:nucleoside-diphosphate-sugar epimerase